MREGQRFHVSGGRLYCGDCNEEMDSLIEHDCWHQGLLGPGSPLDVMRRCGPDTPPDEEEDEEPPVPI